MRHPTPLPPPRLPLPLSCIHLTHQGVLQSCIKTAVDIHEKRREAEEDEAESGGDGAQEGQKKKLSARAELEQTQAVAMKTFRHKQLMEEAGRGGSSIPPSGTQRKKVYQQVGVR